MLRNNAISFPCLSPSLPHPHCPPPPLFPSLFVELSFAIGILSRHHYILAYKKCTVVGKKIFLRLMNLLLSIYLLANRWERKLLFKATLIFCMNKLKNTLRKKNCDTKKNQLKIIPPSLTIVETVMIFDKLLVGGIGVLLHFSIKKIIRVIWGATIPPQ